MTIHTHPKTTLQAVRGNVGEVISEKDQRGQKESLLKDLDLEQVLDRNVENLSGGELQRFAIAVVAAQEGERRRLGRAPGRVLACWAVVPSAAPHILYIACITLRCLPQFTRPTVLHLLVPLSSCPSCLPACLPAADVYMIDEPSSYLDVRQRLKAAEVGGQ